MKLLSARSDILNILISVSFSLLLSACANPNTIQQSEPQLPIDRIVGTKRWIAKTIYVCKGPPPRGQITRLGEPPCNPVSKGEITIIDQVGSSISKGYIVEFPDAKRGWVNANDVSIWTHDEETQKKIVGEKAECDRKGGIRVGMTRTQVYASCWGKPTKINKTVGSYGVHEQLVYGSGDYVYLENGIVRTIQTSN